MCYFFPPEIQWFHAMQSPSPLWTWPLGKRNPSQSAILCRAMRSTGFPRAPQQVPYRAISSPRPGSLFASIHSCTGALIISSAMCHRFHWNIPPTITENTLLWFFYILHHRQPKVSPVFHKKNKVSKVSIHPFFCVDLFFLFRSHRLSTITTSTASIST